MVFSVLHRDERRVSQETHLKASCLLQSPVTKHIAAVFFFIYKAVMNLTTLLQSISSSGSGSSLPLHPCISFFFIYLSTSFSSFLSLPFFCPHCFKPAYLCRLSTRDTNEYASSPKHNLTPFVCYHIPSSLLLSHSCHWFYFDKKPEEETALFFPLPFFSKPGSLCV